nr:MAG TPA: hypothetical protein [Bacteriophage sp.]
MISEEDLLVPPIIRFNPFGCKVSLDKSSSNLFASSSVKFENKISFLKLIHPYFLISSPIK